MSAQLQQPRSTNDGPWCWQIKAALKLIGEMFSESNQLASARSLYLALTQLASDNRSETFTENKALLAHKAGLSISTANRLLKAFEELRLIRIERSMRQPASGYIKAPNTYTLLSIGNETPHSVADKVEEKKEDKENTPKGVHLIPNGKRSSPSFSRNGRGHSLDLYTDDEREMLRDYHRFIEIRKQEYGEKWLRVNRYSEEVRKALEIRCDPQEFREFLQGALKDEDSIPDRLTLVRLCWLNY